jgi:hypothetical protein
MKILLFATLLISTAYADQKEENIATIKASISANIDQRIAQLQTFKSCVQGTSGHEEIKACRKANKAEMKKLHEENKGEREEWKAGKEERKAKKKAEKKSN